MTEPELRALVRDAIARHAAPSGAARAPSDTPFTRVRAHASHAMFDVTAGADTDGPCVIEPAVPCTHCGYCKSYGH
jgi:hypothetical protein